MEIFLHEKALLHSFTLLLPIRKAAVKTASIHVMNNEHSLLMHSKGHASVPFFPLAAGKLTFHLWFKYTVLFLWVCTFILFSSLSGPGVLLLIYVLYVSYWPTQTLGKQGQAPIINKAFNTMLWPSRHLALTSTWESLISTPNIVFKTGIAITISNTHIFT